MPCVLVAFETCSRWTETVIKMSEAPIPWPLPSEITQAFLPLPSRGLKVHYLSTAASQHDQNNNLPLILCLHGFPELSYSWRKVMLPLAKLGYRVVAPDVRGYGQTTGGSKTYVSDSAVKQEFNLVNVAADVQAFVFELGYSEVTYMIFSRPLLILQYRFNC